MDSPTLIEGGVYSPNPLDASVKQAMETTNSRPDLFKLSPFGLECMEFARKRQRHRPASPASPMVSDTSQPSTNTPISQDSGITIASTHAVSDYERTSYYNGITDNGEHPDLLYRTRSDKYPWIQPTGKHPYQPTKSVRGVYKTPLNGIWSTVGPQVRDLVRVLKNRYSIDPARFVTYGEDSQETLGPVVIWIGVYPGSTSADTAYEISQNILELLEKNRVEDVEVEWHEAVSWKAAGPALLRVVDDINPTVHVRRHLTAALGMPIATAEREVDDVQGSVGFFFHEGRDKHGNPSSKVFGVSNRHVLLAENEGMYEFKGAGAPRQYVQLNGHRRFQRGLNEIKVAVSDCGLLAQFYTEEISRLEAKGTSDNNAKPEEETGAEVEVEVEAEKKEVAEEEARQLLLTQQKLEEQKQAIAGLEKFYGEVMTQWKDISKRNIGHVHYSPPRSIDIEHERYTEDWGTFEVDEAKFKAHFMGNVVDLGTAISPEELISIMHSQTDARTAFKYPGKRQLRINGILTQEQLANPDLFDDEGLPRLVLKDGCATDLTIGYYAGLQSFVADEVGVESMELAIYNYDQRSGPFSKKGDSGSLIFDGLGRMVGLLHSGKSRKGFTNPYITYATPAWWLVDRIKERYPHADFYRTTW